MTTLQDAKDYIASGCNCDQFSKTHIEALIAECARLEKNSDRYLWLRNEAERNVGKTPFIAVGWNDADCYVVARESADASIDAMLAARKEQS